MAFTAASRTPPSRIGPLFHRYLCVYWFGKMPCFPPCPVSDGIGAAKTQTLGPASGNRKRGLSTPGSASPRGHQRPPTRET